METINHINNIRYLDVRGSQDETSERLCALGSDSPDVQSTEEFSSGVISLASPRKMAVKLSDFLGQSEAGYKIAGFADSFTGEDSVLLLRNIAGLLSELGISVEFFEDGGEFNVQGSDHVGFSLDGEITESGRDELIGLNAFHYLLCFIDQDFAAVVEKDGEMQYLCDVSCFEKTPKATDGSNPMLGANFLEFHANAPNFGDELSRALPRVLESFSHGDLDMLVVDLNGQDEYELKDEVRVRRFERDKFLPIFDEDGQLKGFFGLADVFMQDIESGEYHPEVETQADLLRQEIREDILRNSAYPELLLSEIDDEDKIRIVRTLLANKEDLHEEILTLAADLNLKRFGDHLELYGISYISDRCVNDCKYCGHNAGIHRVRSSLTEAEMAEDFEAVLRHEPDEFCILTGESPDAKELIICALGVLGEVNEKCGSPLKRISLNVPPMNEAVLREIVSANTSGVHLQFRVFQESYDRAVYEKLHTRGPKRDFEYRLMAQDRALSAGFDSVGIGALLGLNAESDEEIIALVKHALDLRRKFGQLPSSLSLPRHQAVDGYDFETPHPVEDKAYIFYHALLRLALPEVELIITSRENEDLIRELEPLINIRDLAPRPGVGGNMRDAVFQNELGDSRDAEEIITDLVARGKR